MVRFKLLRWFYCNTPLSYTVIIRDIIAKRVGVPVSKPATPEHSENTVTEAEPTSEEGTAPKTGESYTDLNKSPI